MWIWVQQLHILHRTRADWVHWYTIYSTTWPTPAAAQWRQWTHHSRYARVMTFHFYDAALLFYFIIAGHVSSASHSTPMRMVFFDNVEISVNDNIQIIEQQQRQIKNREENCHHCRDNITAVQPIHCHSKWEANNTIDELSCLLRWGAGSSVMLTLPPLSPTSTCVKYVRVYMCLMIMNRVKFVECSMRF